MDSNIKKENPNVTDNNLRQLSENNNKIPIKKTIVDDRNDDVKYYGNLAIENEKEYKNLFSRRPSYPWEDDVLKERKYSEEEIKKIKTVYQNKKEVEKITIPSTKLVKAVVKYKGQQSYYQPYGQSGASYQGQPVQYKYGKQDYYNTSYPNGWPILPISEQGRLASDKLPGINAQITTERSILPLFYNLIYDLNISVEKLTHISCFNYRKIRGYENRPDRWSTHASGTAIDYNHRNHPLNVANTFNINQQLQIQKLIKRYGIQWGGNFRNRPDDMHFEIAVSPDVAKQIIQSLNLEKRMLDIKSGIRVSVN